MKRFLFATLVGALVLGVSSAAYANVCAFDPVPAVTLLFPFVIFDYNNPTAGANTLMAITNVSDEAVIVHVTFWSDLSVPVLDFNILLSGYDVQTMSVRDILHYGILPVTCNQIGSGYEVPALGAVEDPQDDGPVSNAHALWVDDILPTPESTIAITALECPQTASPCRYAGGLSQNDLDTLRFYFTASQGATRRQVDFCDFQPGVTTYTPQIHSWWDDRTLADPTWVYVTADLVQICNRLFPNDTAYWAPTMMRVENVLIGDIFYVDDLSNFSEAMNAVHIEADPQLATVATLDNVGGPGLGNPISFYYRYTIAQQVGSDFREPLPTAWAVRYVGVDLTAIDTYLRVFKASTFHQQVPDLTIGAALDARDCYAYTYFAWDEDEGVIRGADDPWSDPEITLELYNLIPLETQEFIVDDLNTPGSYGWILFVWPNSNFDAITGVNRLIPDYYQTWTGVKYSAFQKFSAVKDGTVMANFNCFSDQVLTWNVNANQLGVNYDYVTAGYNTSPVYTNLVGILP